MADFPEPWGSDALPFSPRGGPSPAVLGIHVSICGHVLSSKRVVQLTFELAMCSSTPLRQLNLETNFPAKSAVWEGPARSQMKLLSPKVR